MVGVAQLVSAPDCGSGGRGFESLYPPCSSILIYIYGGIAQLARAHGSYPWCRRFKSYSRYLHGILAQLGEHLPYKQRVTGSSPVGPILLKDINQYGEVAQLARASGSYPGG